MATDLSQKLESVRGQGATVRSATFLLVELIRAAFYFISFLPLFLTLSHFRSSPVYVLLLLTIGGLYFGGLVWLALLVLTKRFFVGHLETNRVVTVESSLAKRFFCAATLHGMMQYSPFRLLVSGVSPLTAYYYRGMGASMLPSIFISNTARIADPWFITIEENVTIGGDSLILGHAGNGREIILGTVVIEAGAIIGGRSLILPNVRIGKGARVGAGAVVASGSVIPDGETWAGVPARKILPHSNSAVPEAPHFGTAT